MRIVSTKCISKKKTVRHYVDFIVKVFEENSEIIKGGVGRFECQLRTSKSGVCLGQNWMFVDRGEERGGVSKFILFLRRS